MTGVRVAIAVGLSFVAIVLIAELASSEQRLAGSNARVDVSGAAVPIRAHGRRCQNDFGIPEKAYQLRLYFGTFGRSAGPVDVVMHDDTGRVVSRAGYPAPLTTGARVARLTPPVEKQVSPVSVCIANRGHSRIQLAGDRTPPFNGGANPSNVVLADNVRLDFLRPGRESGFDIAPAVARRFGLEKATFFGPWTMWAVVALVLLIAAAAVTMLYRSLRPA